MSTDTKIAIISTIRAPVKQVSYFIKFHTDIGIDHIFLYFDDPEDRVCDAFSELDNITAVLCTEKYWRISHGARPKSVEERQVINVNHGVLKAKESGCNWVIHIDIDELVLPKKNIKEIFSATDEDGLRFELCEAVSEREKYESVFSPTLFKKKSSSFKVSLARFLGCRNSIFDGEYLRGHSASKMAVKINPEIETYGIHRPEKCKSDIYIRDTKDIKLLHFDCVGIKDWKRKWSRRIDGSGEARLMRKNRSKQFEEFKEASIKGEAELKKLYRRLHTIPLYEKIVLRVLRMLIRIKIS